MVRVLVIGGRPELTDHEAYAISMLLDVIRTPVAASLASRLDPTRSGEREVELSPLEKRALADALGELRRNRIPDHLIAIASTLAGELAAEPSEEKAAAPARDP